MLKKFFPLKLIIAPTDAFAEISGGKIGWTWPLTIYAVSIFTSSLLLALVPPEFLAKASSDLPAPSGTKFLPALAAGLPSGLVFNMFFCALSGIFLKLLRSGRLMFRLPLPFAAVGVYALFFVYRLNTAGGGAAGWMAAGAALAFSVWTILQDTKAYVNLLKVLLSICVFGPLMGISEFFAFAVDMPRLYGASEYFFAFLSLIWMIRGTAAVSAMPAAKAFVAVLTGLLGAAAFAYSLLSLGLISPEMFQMLLLM